MALTPGTRLGAYEIIARLGAGGMGEVYRAKDVKLGREIALKTLPDSFTHDPDRVVRFQREAQILAALNHPHIGAIYGLDEANGIQFLVLELVDGETLEQRITRGATPLDEGLRIAGEIAGALSAAHAKGVVHRDLKPANIALTKDGRVKVLDFGLAKGTDAASATLVDATQSPTMAPPAITGVGMLLGTAAYMSPEQARGYPADRQSDIWAFGCVVYETLTGRRLFTGATVTDTLAAVLTREPDWERAPARARRLLRRCLERDPRRRLHDISDAVFLLDEEAADTAPGRSRPWPWLAAGLAVIALAVVSWSLRPPVAVDRHLMRLALDLEPDRTTLADAAISPDGARIVFYTRDADGRLLLATRRFDESRVTTLAGTEGADQPFFSPDGQWIGYFTGTKLMKIQVQGGTPTPLSDARVPRGASWGEDGTIIAALSNRVGLSRVPAGGGEPQPLSTTSEADPTHRWPQILPGGKAVLFTANTPTINSYEDATIDVQSLPAGLRKTVWRGGYFGRYVATGQSRGHLVFIRRGVLFAAPFDLDRLEVDGPPSPLLEDIAADSVSGAGFFDFSRDGTFVYRSGAGLRPWIVAWLDASGQTTPLLAKPALYYSPRFSPDGQRLAIGIDNGKGMDTFIADLQRNTMSRVTFTTGTNWDPVWAPDGKHLLIRSGSTTGPSIWWVRADGGAEPIRLLDVSAGDLAANSFSPDGRTWIYSSTASNRFDADLWTISFNPTDPDRPTPGKPILFLDSPGDQTRPAISPDGRWVAYQSNETGSGEVYIRPLSAPVSGGARWQVSTSGGGQPMWSRAARQIFFTSGDQIMMADYTIAGDSFVASKPRLWSPATFLARTGFTALDLAPDGNRFAILQDGEPTDRNSRPRVTLLLNFFEEIRRRSPTP